jgi:DNA-binding CsgD family transcriptional regulator
MHGRTSPCERCPALALEGAQFRTAVVRAPDGELWIESAAATGANEARVSASHVPAQVLSDLLSAHVESSAERAGLTGREREVLRLAVAGRSPSEIAVALRISRSTAKFHVSNLLAKLGAESRRDLLRKLL